MRHPGLYAGVVLAIASIADAVYNGARLMVLVAVVGGIVAAWWTRSRQSGTSARAGAKAGLVAGATAGLVVVALGSPLLAYVLRTESPEGLRRTIELSSLALPSSPIGAVAVGMLVYAAVEVVLATVAGAVTGATLRRPPAP